MVTHTAKMTEGIFMGRLRKSQAGVGGTGYVRATFQTGS